MFGKCIISFLLSKYFILFVLSIELVIIFGYEVGVIFFIAGLSTFIVVDEHKNFNRDLRNLREYYAQRQTQKQVFDKKFLEVRTAVLKRDGYRCVNCGQTGTELHVHHIIPRSEGGTNDLSNLVTLCGKCHSIQDAKGHKLIQKRLDEDLSEEHAGLVASNEQEDSEALFW
jgi:diadenosine tetraphosphate (Ap4A) HIT family hydrolase